MLDKIIMAGFGGQGLLFMGKLIAQMMMEQGRNITYFPSYGAEVRGGTCNCHVVASDDEIHSPVVENATSLVIMNAPSYTRFAPLLERDGLLVLNTSIVHDYKPLGWGRIMEVPATDVANELGDMRVANMVMLGAFVETRKLVTVQALKDHMADVLGGKKPEMIEINISAINRGIEIAKKAGTRTNTD